MLHRSYILAEATLRDFDAGVPEVAVLPWGATEAHNYHLPYMTDVAQAQRVGAESARLACEAGARVVVLPTIPFGVQTGQLDIPLCINMNPSTQLAVLRDIVSSLSAQGVKKLVVLNGHGGNDFRAMLRELAPTTNVFLCTLDWYRAVDPRPYFDQPGDHAGELETSCMMHIAPGLVRPLSEAGDGAQRHFTVRAARGLGVVAPPLEVCDLRHRHRQPARRDGRQGERYLRAVSEKIAGFLVELAKTDASRMYERE